MSAPYGLTMNHFRMAMTAWVVASVWLVAEAAAAFPTDPAARVSPDDIMRSLRILPQARAPLGDDEHRRGLRETERLISDRLRELGYEPIAQPIEWVSPALRLGRRAADGAGVARGGQDDTPSDVNAPPDTPDPPDFWNNIIVETAGVDLPGEVVLIGAHFDAVARSPGADDNGSGTAALLEVARVLRDQPLRRTVRLVFFNLEEIGLIGSRHHAARHAADHPDQRIVAMVSLEAIGYYCTEPGCQKTPVEPIKGVFEPSTIGDFLAAVTIAAHQDVNRRFTRAFESASMGLRIEPFDFLPVPIPDILRSDHAPFLAQGIPSIMLTGTANFRNPHYHKPTDTIETIDLERLTRAVRGIVAATIDLAERPAPPDADDALSTTTPTHEPSPKRDLYEAESSAHEGDRQNKPSASLSKPKAIERPFNLRSVPPAKQPGVHQQRVQVVHVSPGFKEARTDRLRS